MSNEIQRTTKLSWSKNNAQIIASTTETFDQTGDQAVEQVQIIGSTSEQIDFAGLSGRCHFMFKNMEKEWKDLTSTEQASYTGSTTALKRADYETKYTVYIGTTDPVTSLNANYTLRPGAGVTFEGTLVDHFGIRNTNDVHLLVMVVEA